MAVFRRSFTNRLSRTFYLCCLALSILNLPAQSTPAYVVSSFTTDTGLPQNSVKDVVQTPDGYIWVATQEGLARFDGVRFTVFNTRTAPGLVSNNAHQLVVDGAGDMWVLANSSVSRYRDGVFEDVTPTTSGVDRMLYLWRGGDGYVYAVSDSSLWRSGPSGFTILAPLSKCFPEHDFFFECGRDGTVWLLGQKSLRLVEIKGGSVRVFDESGHGIFSGLTVDDDGTVWLAGTRLWTVSATGKLTAMPAVIPPAGQSIAWLITDEDGTLWFWLGKRLCTYRHGDAAVHVVGTSNAPPSWCRFDQYGNYWSLFPGKLQKLWLISQGKLASLSVDAPVATEWELPVIRTADGVAFIGTYAGLQYVYPGRCETLGAASGVPAGEVQSIYQTRDGTLWVAGLPSTGPTFGTIRGGHFEPSTDPHLARADVSSMAEDTGGTLWISTASNHLWRVDDGRSTDARRMVSGVPASTPVSTLAADPRGGVWLGMGRSLVYLKDGHSTVYPIPADAPMMGQTYAVTVLRDGRVLVGGQQGFACLDHGRISCYGPEVGLPSVPAICICEDRNGNDWLGLWGGGLARFKDGKVTCLTTRDGLYADSIQSIVDGGGRELWMGSSKGVFSVDRDQLARYTDGIASGSQAGAASIECSPLGMADGMEGGQSAAARQPLAIKAIDCSLWFACARGVAHVSATPLSFHRATQFPVVVERAVVDKAAIALNGHAVARPGPGNLQVDYTALNFQAPDKTRFLYRLDGFDTAWTDAGTRRNAYYTNLPPGRYRFQVIACDAFGNWNRAGASLDFVIQPHYYQTIWFRVMIVLACLAAGLGLGIGRVRQLQRLNRILEAKVDERTKLLEEANRQLWDSREELLAQNEELQAVQAELEVRNDELADVNVQLGELATVDALTGLKNRRVMQERLADSFRIAARYRSDFSIVMLDVDHFKAYNDTFGHPAGDEVLKRVASLLASVARDTDYLARYGGEEFVVMMPLTGAAGACQVAERMRSAIESAHWTHRPVTASFGVACMDAGFANADDLVSAADSALYTSKKSGKNRVTLYVDTAASRAAA